MGDTLEDGNNATNTGEHLNGPSLLNNLYVGKEVIFTGELTESPDPVKFTHLLQLVSNEKVGIVSTKTSITNYSGKVSVKGTVKSYDDNMYVVDVSFITTDMESDLDGEGSSEKTYIPAGNLMVDVSSHPSALSVKVESDRVSITDETSEQADDTITLTYFTCQKNDPIKDCQKIISTANAGDQFTNTQGITFYKLPETSKWFGANETMGYMINAPKDAFFYKISSYLYPLNTKYIQSRITAQATNYCYNSTSRLSATTKQTTTVKNNTWTTNIEGTDTDGKKVTCVLDIKFSEHSESITLSSYIISNEGGAATPGSTGGNTSTPTPGVPSNVGKVPGPTATGYMFISTRGNYSIFFPSQKISFEGVNLTESFGLEKTTCYVDIQVKAYADRDNANVAPGVEIYECVTKLTAEAIKAKLPQYTVVESKDETKMFIVKTNDASWASFSNGIIIE